VSAFRWRVLPQSPATFWQPSGLRFQHLTLSFLGLWSGLNYFTGQPFRILKCVGNYFCFLLSKFQIYFVMSAFQFSEFQGLICKFPLSAFRFCF
jgi:hypothetical protein